MSVLDREALEASPLADLHTIASELSVDGYRRLRKADLIATIIARQSGQPVPEPEPTEAEAATDAESDVDTDSEDETGEESAASSRRRRGRRGGRGRSGAREGSDELAESSDAETEATAKAGRNGRGDRPEKTDRPARADRAERSDKPDTADAEPATVEGVVELLPNGSGFVRVSPPEPSDEDVYISAAQVKRCELVSGDTLTGPRRPPQRSERFASLVRIDTINGAAAAEVADRARYDDLPATFPAERFKLASEDETLKAIEFLTPLGRGSRVALTGATWAGKSHTLKQLAAVLAQDESLTVFVALTGVRPEELSEWAATDSGLPATAASLSFGASADAQDHAVELVIDQAKRVATRGADAVVLIDTLDRLHPHTAHKVLAAARNLTDGGSLTVIATAARPFGGETTVIALDAGLASIGRYPALDLVNSGTLRPELLVGEAGAKAIADARAEALGV